MTTLLFGDNLQTELTHIRATNTIGFTASFSSCFGQRRNYQSPVPRQGQGRHLFRASASAVRSTDELHILRQLEAPIQPLQLGEETTRHSTEEINTNTVEKLPSIGVSQYIIYPSRLVEYFKYLVSSFEAGRIAHYLDVWKIITYDSEILIHS